jgi:hypothetical protein
LAVVATVGGNSTFDAVLGDILGGGVEVKVGLGFLALEKVTEVEANHIGG